MHACMHSTHARTHDEDSTLGALAHSKGSTHLPNDDDDDDDEFARLTKEIKR